MGGSQLHVSCNMYSIDLSHKYLAPGRVSEWNLIKTYNFLNWHSKILNSNGKQPNPSVQHSTLSLCLCRGSDRLNESVVIANATLIASITAQRRKHVLQL